LLEKTLQNDPFFLSKILERLVILIVFSATNPFEYGHKLYAKAPQLYQFIVVNCPEQIPYDLIFVSVVNEEPNFYSSSIFINNDKDPFK
jgi:hypothetical protein